MKVAVILPQWIGDTCMATPALRAIAAAPNVEELVLVGRPAPLQLLEGLPYVNDCIAYRTNSRSLEHFSRRETAAELRRRSIDAIALFPNSLSSAMIAWLARIPIRVGFAKNGRGVLLTKSISLRSRPTQDPLHIADDYTASSWLQAPLIDYYLHIASHLGISVKDRRMELCATGGDRELANAFFAKIQFESNRPLVIINNAAATSPSRLWPEEHVVKLAKLLANDGKQVLFHAGPSDREASLNFAAAASHRFVRSLGEEESLPLGLSRGVIAQSDLVISTDSGPRHMAIALNRPVVSLFGPTQFEVTKTYNRPEHIEQVIMSCRPCRKDQCPLGHNSCMRDISPDSVYQRAQRILKSAQIVAA